MACRGWGGLTAIPRLPSSLATTQNKHHLPGVGRVWASRVGSRSHWGLLPGTSEGHPHLKMQGHLPSRCTPKPCRSARAEKSPLLLHGSAWSTPRSSKPASPCSPLCCHAPMPPPWTHSPLNKGTTPRSPLKWPPTGASQQVQPPLCSQGSPLSPRQPARV